MKGAILSLINNSVVKQKEYPHFPDILKILSKGKKMAQKIFTIFFRHIGFENKHNVKLNSLFHFEKISIGNV